MNTKFKNHKHTWIVTTTAIVLAVVLLVLIPQNKSYSIFFMGMAGGHLILALIALFTGWILIPQKFLDRIFKKKPVEGFDFGWSYKWIYGYLAASFLTFILAIHLFFSLSAFPVAQLITFTTLLLLSVNLFIGNLIISNTNRRSKLTLPMVNLLEKDNKMVLDAGCGAGRTTIALAEEFPDIKITAFDKFDADYIEESGKNLIIKNIKYAGIEDRVTIQKGDILNTPFKENEFDAIVSSYMIDHLHQNKKSALEECYRILKPGGRFLLIIVVRGNTAFGVASMLSLFLTSKNTWIKWIEQTGFKMLKNGKINEGTYFLFEK
jgi:ubiquinone/menaquinone biosynthesis C-methylase UbiE